jgi:hypothetical protein
MKEQDQEAETLRKAEAKQNKAEATALKTKKKEKAKVAREEAKKVRQVKASERAAARVQKEQKQLLQKPRKQPTYLQRVYVLPPRNPGQGQSQSAVHCSCKVVKIMARDHLN